MTKKPLDTKAEPHLKGLAALDGKIGQVFRYSKGVAKSLPFQWCGWSHRVPGGKWVRMSMWIRFIDTVPALSSNFGFKIHGSVQNKWLRMNNLRPNEWNFVSAIAPGCNRDGSHLLLIFDSIAQRQVADFAGLKCEIFESARDAEEFDKRESERVLQLSVVPEHVDWVAAQTGKSLRKGGEGRDSPIGAVERLTVQYHTERGLFTKSAKGNEVLELHAAKLVILHAELVTSTGTTDVTEIVQAEVGR